MFLIKICIFDIFQLVELNPYAALCNQMLKETFDKLKKLE